MNKNEGIRTYTVPAHPRPIYKVAWLTPEGTDVLSGEIVSLETALDTADARVDHGMQKVRIYVTETYLEVN